VAHATDPVGPAHVNSGAVVATASAPYAIATPETGDTTNVVSASYVKGAYNDAIAAINNVASKVSNVESDLDDLSIFVNGNIEDEIAGKQDKLTILESGDAISDGIIGVATFDDYMRQACDNNHCSPLGAFENNLITADATAAGIAAAINRRGVNAVTAWGNDNNTTVLNFVPNND